jgi:hypothetical protein
MGVFQFWGSQATAFGICCCIIDLARKTLKYAFENSARRIFPCGEAVDFRKKL